MICSAHVLDSGYDYPHFNYKRARDLICLNGGKMFVDINNKIWVEMNGIFCMISKKDVFDDMKKFEDFINQRFGKILKVWSELIFSLKKRKGRNFSLFFISIFY